MHNPSAPFSLLLFFWRHIKPYKWYYAVMLSAPIIGSFYGFANHYAIKLFVDAMTAKATLEYADVFLPIALFLIAELVVNVIWRISNVAELRAEPYVRRAILLESYDYVQRLPYTFFQDQLAGSISSKLKSILDGYDKFWAEMHHGLFQKCLQIIVGLSAIAFVNARLGVALLMWCLVFVPVMYVLSTRLNHLVFEASESRHVLIGQISDRISNIVSVMTFATHQREYRKLDAQVCEDFIPKEIRVYRYDIKIQIILGLFYSTILIFILFYMIHLRRHRLVSVGDFAFVFGMFIWVMEEIWQLVHSLQDFSRIMGDCQSALSILSVPHTQQDRCDAQPLQIKKACIVFHDVRFAYHPDHPVFNAFNLEIQSGEKVGLVGHSGAGKSTLANLLLRFFDLSSGAIVIDGQNIADVTQDSLRRSIAIIPQDTMLLHRSLMENIRYGNLDATDAEVIAASQKAHIHDYIMTLPEGYASEVGERGVKLSGGQRQRIAIARAILKDAPILILDEATAALDSETEKSIQDSLNFLIQDKKKTVIAIAHRLSTLKPMDRILILDHGVIVEEGTHNALLKRKDSMYKKLWAHQTIC